MDSRGRLVVFMLISMVLVAVPDALAQSLEFDVQRGLQYGQHDGVQLTGDLYAPKAPGQYPALVAVHGGGWQVGNAGFYEHWGPYLAQHGYVLFAINYRLVRGARSRTRRPCTMCVPASSSFAAAGKRSRSIQTGLG